MAVVKKTVKKDETKKKKVENVGEPYRSTEKKKLDYVGVKSLEIGLNNTFSKLNDFNKKINSGEYIDQSDFETYRSTVRQYLNDKNEYDEILNSSGVYDEKTADRQNRWISGVVTGINNADRFFSQFNNEKEYNDAKRAAEFIAKYGNSTAEERAKAINDLKVQRAKGGYLEGENEDIDTKIAMLENYSMYFPFSTSAEYDEEISRLEKNLKEYGPDIKEDGSFWSEVESFFASMFVDYNEIENVTELENRLKALKTARDALKTKEDIWAPYIQYLDADDFEVHSKYIGGADDVYNYINSSKEQQANMRTIEAGQHFTNTPGDIAYIFMPSKYGDYDQLTPEEIEMYNYLHAVAPKKADEFLTKLSPELAKRRNKEVSDIAMQAGRENPFSASVLSLASNLASGAAAPLSIAASAFGVDIPELDRASALTSGLRSGAGETASKLNVNVPVIDKNLGELLYGTVMSLADVGTASLFGAGLGGTEKAAARITQAIMSSSAASNAVYSAHERGLYGVEVAARGILAGAIEWATEKYSIESLFSDGSKGIIIDALKQMGIEASEETASSILNILSDEIISGIAGHTDEIDNLTNRYMVEEGLSYEEARRRAIIDTVQEVGADALAGALSGGAMGAGKGTVNKIVSRGNTAAKKYDTETLPVGEIGEVSVGVGKAGAYEVQLTENEGEVKTVDVDSLSRNSPEYKILRAAEDSHMTPAVADAVLRGYDGSVPVSEYVAEAEYVSAAAKAGTAYEAILKGSDTLSEGVRRAIWEDGRTYSENITKARQTFLDEVKAKSDGKVMSGRFDTKEIKGMKLNRTQERAVKTAEALSSLGFNIRMVKSIGGDSRKLGYYDKRTGDIVVSVNARSRNIEGAIKSQILPTMAHEITHSFRATSPELYSQYSEVVLGALYGSGELQRLVESEFARLRDSGRFAEATDAEIYDAAYDELVARASEDMLADPKAIEKICRENRTVGEKILEAIDRFISTLKSILSGSSEESVHEEARILRGMLKEYEAARELWVKALADSAETRAAQAEEGDVVREYKSAEGDRQFNEAVEGNADVEITMADVQALRSIRRKSINDFTREDIEKTEPWARKFFRELGVKSPFFRAWFGDWREFDNKTKVPIIPVNSDILAVGDVPRGDFNNYDTGWNITSNSDGIGETANKEQKRSDSYHALKDIDKLLKHAVLLDTVVVTKPSKRLGKNAVFMHHLYCPVKSDGNIGVAKLYIAESFEDNHKFYLLRIEKASSAMGFSTADSTSTPHSNAATDDATFSIAEIFDFVKKHDKDFEKNSKERTPFSPKPASKVVNPDGTPKVMYHGSPNQFTVFDKKLSKSSNLYGRGFYFTDSDAHAGVYGELYKVYLNIKNPLSPGGSKITKPQIRTFLEAVAENEDYSIENYGTYDVDEILSKITSRDAFAVIQGINATAIGDFAEAIELFNEVNGTKYDGIITDTETVVFSSNQIKSATDNIGTFDVNNPDIRFNEALDDELTMREVLTGALEGAALTEADEKVLERYRRRVREIDGYDERLREVNREIKEISFAKGKRDTARLSELKSEKAQLEQDLKRADRKLLELSSTEALKNLFDREAKRLRREKSEALRAATKEARRMSEAHLKEAVEKERERGVAAKAGERMAAEAEIAEIRRRAAERELKDRTRRERLDVEKRIRRVISYVTSQTDDKNVKQGLRGVVADFAHAILSNNAAYTQSEMTRMRERYEEIAEAGEGVEFIHKGAYDFNIFEELKNLEGELKGRAWRDLTIAELGTVDRVTRNLMHMIRLENKIFRNGKAESRVKIGEACERAIAECVSRRKEKTTPKGKVGQAVQRFGDEVDRLIVTGNLMPVYYFDILGGEFEALYNDLVDGQNKWSRIVEDSARKADEIKEKYDFDKLTKGETVFTTDEGVSFEMTVREAMYFYAAFKRETLRGDTEHYLKGGIASDKIVSKAKGDNVKRYRSGTVRLSGDDVAMILDSLSTEQKAFVDELVAYLSTDIARYGNETSMELYGIEKFGDEYYIPYRVSGDAILKGPIEAAEPDKGKGGGEAKIKHTGMTNAIKHGAGNAMEQADIMEVFTKHCVEMANYAAFAVPIENIGGVLNFRGASGDLLRAEMRSKLGDNMTSYFDTFIRDMNGGVKTTASGIEKFLSLQKKASVAASLSTVVQQPTAMFRAMAMIDPKYFVTVKGGETMKGIRASWDEMKQYAPGVTVVKDMGKFDVGSGVSAAEYISGDMTFGKAVDKAAGFAAEWADKLTWIHIWKACKAEAKAKGLRGEELLTSAGKRFTDVINRTQVYDSTLVRSETMRSRNALMKPFTAFKAEPTVTLNVMADAVRSKSPAKIARTASALLVSTIVNNALRALVYAGRDDDEEKGYFEKYGVEFSEGLVEDMMLWNYVPFVSDLASITKGFKSKRMEMQLFESVYNSFNALWEEDAGWREWATFVGDVGNFAGLPVKNVIRDFVMMPMNIANSSDNSVRGAWYAAIDTLGNSTTGKNLKKIGINITNTDYDGYIEALESGDSDEAEKIFGAIIDYKVFKARRKAEAEGKEFDEDEARGSAESSVRSKVSEHLKTETSAYVDAVSKGDVKAARSALTSIVSVKKLMLKVEAEAAGEKYDEKDALKRIKSSLQSEVTSEVLSDKYDVYTENLGKGDVKAASKTAREIMEVLLSSDKYFAEATGTKYREDKSREAAESKLRSKVTEYFKKRYVAADYDTQAEIRQILRATGLYENVRSTAKAWVKASEEEDE